MVLLSQSDPIYIGIIYFEYNIHIQKITLSEITKMRENGNLQGSPKSMDCTVVVVAFEELVKLET